MIKEILFRASFFIFDFQKKICRSLLCTALSPPLVSPIGAQCQKWRPVIWISTAHLLLNICSNTSVLSTNQPLVGTPRGPPLHGSGVHPGPAGLGGTSLSRRLIDACVSWLVQYFEHQPGLSRTEFWRKNNKEFGVWYWTRVCVSVLLITIVGLWENYFTSLGITSAFQVDRGRVEHVCESAL